MKAHVISRKIVIFARRKKSSKQIDMTLHDINYKSSQTLPAGQVVWEVEPKPLHVALLV